MLKLSFFPLILLLLAGVVIAQAPINTPDNNGAGNCLNFAGVAQQGIVMPTSNAYNFGTGSYSIESWVRLNSVTGEGVVIGRMNGCGSNTGWRLQVHASNGTVSTYIGTTAITSTASVMDGNWHHIAGVRNGATLTLYIDGEQAAQRNDVASQNATANNNPEMRVGSSNAHPCNPTGGSSPIDGAIDEVRVWNRALTQIEVKDRMCKQLDPNNETGLVGYWTINEGSGNTVNDLTATSNHGTRQ